VGQKIAQAGVGLDSDIERPVSATSRYGRSAVRLVDMKDALPLSVVARHSKYDVLDPRFLVPGAQDVERSARAWNEVQDADRL